MSTTWNYKKIINKDISSYNNKGDLPSLVENSSEVSKVDMVPTKDNGDTCTVGGTHGVEIPVQKNITNINFHKYDNYVLKNYEKISVGPDFKWPEVYEHLKTQSGLLHQSFPGNTTKVCGSC